jgi:uncharacterized protein (TIGR03435 family)
MERIVRITCGSSSSRFGWPRWTILIFVLAFSIAAVTTAAQTSKSNGEGTVATAAPFDVVSIKPDKSGSQNMSWMHREASFEATNITLRGLVADAYGIRYNLISGLPGWADSELFDVDAKIVDPDMEQLKKLTSKQKNARLVMILADRFNLKAHLETKTVPVYELVVAKNGPKFRQGDPALSAADLSKLGEKPTDGSLWMNGDELTAKGVSMESLARHLEGLAGRPIFDKTGITGKYDLHLKWRIEQTNDSSGDAAGVAAPIFGALQEQLGLKLQAAKGQVDSLVVDHVEQPTGN